MRREDGDTKQQTNKQTMAKHSDTRRVSRRSQPREVERILHVDGPIFLRDSPVGDYKKSLLFKHDGSDTSTGVSLTGITPSGLRRLADILERILIKNKD